jgi:hypothetical protein
MKCSRCKSENKSAEIYCKVCARCFKADYQTEIKVLKAQLVILKDQFEHSQQDLTHFMAASSYTIDDLKRQVRQKDDSLPKLKWRVGKPTVAGYYWIYSRCPLIAYWNDKYFISSHGYGVLAGTWAGPIQQPVVEWE